MQRKTIVKVVGYDNLLSNRQGFYIYDINNDGLWLHNRETDEIVNISHDYVLCYWYKCQWVYVSHNKTKGDVGYVKSFN